MSPLSNYLQARGRSAQELAVATGMAVERCVQLVEGAEATVSEVLQVATHLGVPPRVLILPGDKEGPDHARFRFNFDANKNKLSLVEFGYAVQRLRAASLMLGKEKNVPFFVDFPRSYKSAEFLANVCRSGFLEADDSEPLINLSDRIFYKMGSPTIVGNYRAIEGIALRSAGSSLILVARRNDMRMRFTVAHELAHLLCDVNEETVDSWIDEDIFTGQYVASREERFANAFAACLLLPRSGVARSLKEARSISSVSGVDGITAFDIMTLAYTFGVSFFVAARRLEMLNIVPEGTARALDKNIKKKFKSAESFARSAGFPERQSFDWFKVSRQVAYGASRMIVDGIISHEEAAFTLGLEIGQIADRPVDDVMHH